MPLRVPGHHPRRLHVPVLDVVPGGVLRQGVHVVGVSLVRVAGSRGVSIPGAVDARDVVDARPAFIFFVHAVEADEVFLRVRRDLSRRPTHNKVPRNAPPVPFSKLGQPQQEQPVLLLRPRYAFPAFLVAGFYRSVGTGRRGFRTRVFAASFVGSSRSSGGTASQLVSVQRNLVTSLSRRPRLKLN